MIERFFEKRLPPRERDEPEARARFASEAAILTHLAGRGAPRLLAEGEDAHGPFLRLALVTQPTLATRIGTVDDAWARRAARAAFAALALVHEARDAHGPLAIVHADLSPGNVCAEGDEATILDFDLAWWRDGPVRDGAFRGTVAYVAPEVARGERPTVQSDLFALAAAFRHVLTAEELRTGPSFAARLLRAAEEPMSPCAIAPLAACLASAARDRPASARLVATAL